MPADTGAIQGRKDGLADGMAGRPRDPRPDFRLRMDIPGYAAAYAASYEVSYNAAFADRDRILREAALRQDRERLHEGAGRTNRADGQADLDREI